LAKTTLPDRAVGLGNTSLGYATIGPVAQSLTIGFITAKVSRVLVVVITDEAIVIGINTVPISEIVATYL